MILRDRVTKISTEETVRAHVFSASMASAMRGGGSGTQAEPIYWDLSQQLTAIVEPRLPWSVSDRVRWNGSVYVVTSVAIRSRRGRAHHYTISLETEPEQ